ncbi:hypothetical protein Y032_0171g336 [Ancylostoma ceylanicum]|uniref:Uncharacterized protein n=1 Tax=Ancylostoma ceylanicum TaxID=53326 RepID=A0A016SVH6_9BILA|nr:hypothetical protein Y032_0171g336 [Ancylostoma ceylanicum]
MADLFSKIGIQKQLAKETFYIHSNLFSENLLKKKKKKQNRYTTTITQKVLDLMVHGLASVTGKTTPHVLRTGNVEKEEMILRVSYG